MTDIKVKRIYEAPAKSDGYRILVDRLWPRGVAKERAHLNLWAKDITPSAELRQAFHHDELTFEGFAQQYRAELVRKPALANFIDTVKGKKTITLLTASRDPARSHVPVLVAALKKGLLHS